MLSRQGTRSNAARGLCAHNPNLHFSVQWNIVKVFSRSFARAVAGRPVSMSFDAKTAQFEVVLFFQPIFA